MLNKILRHVFNGHYISGYVAMICVWLVNNMFVAGILLIVSVMCFIGQDIIDAIKGKNNANNNSN